MLYAGRPVVNVCITAAGDCSNWKVCFVSSPYVACLLWSCFNLHKNTKHITLKHSKKGEGGGLYIITTESIIYRGFIYTKYKNKSDSFLTHCVGFSWTEYCSQAPFILCCLCVRITHTITHKYHGIKIWARK